MKLLRLCGLLALAALAGLGSTAGPAAAQSSAGNTDPCEGESRRQFDFWLGSWRVLNPAGRQVGTNRISRVSEGCALLEEWRNAQGKTGTSLNSYRDGQWHQYWVGGNGVFLHLTGGLEGEAMVMSGRHTTPDGDVHDRITWTPLSDGRVEQKWEQSPDGEANWSVVFRGLYERVDAGATMAAGEANQGMAEPETMAAESAPAAEAPDGPTACVEPEAHRFDFWPGVWNVESRRLDASGEWRESTNRWRAERVLGGCAFVDYADGDFGTGRLRGMGTRYYDPAEDRWYITWMSTESPGDLETWEGGFAGDGSAEFFAEIETAQGALLSRIRWWDIREDSVEWEHAISRDDGATWTPTWRMTFTRAR